MVCIIYLVFCLLMNITWITTKQKNDPFRYLRIYLGIVRSYRDCWRHFSPKYQFLEVWTKIWMFCVGNPQFNSYSITSTPPSSFLNRICRLFLVFFFWQANDYTTNYFTNSRLEHHIISLQWSFDFCISIFWVTINAQVPSKTSKMVKSAKNY